MDFENLSPDLKAKARQAESPEEIMALAREEGYDLSDEELESIAGGWGGSCGNYCTSDCRIPFSR